MSHVSPSCRALVTLLVALVLAAANCAPAVPSGPSPLATGTQFLQAMIDGNMTHAATMISPDRHSPATTTFLEKMASALPGCTSSSTAFSSRADQGDVTVSVAFTPACGNRSLMYPSYAGRNNDERVASCEVRMESVHGEWKPRPDTAQCESR
jgi:hypothetical protein